MKIAKIVLLTLAVCGLTFTLAFAAGSAAKGKALFNDPKLGTNGKSCNDCHPNGEGLIGAGTKKEWKTPGGAHKSLEEAVNTCITMALKGKALKVKSGKMKDLVAYIKSLKAPTPAAAPAEKPKKKPAMGC